MYDTVRNTIVLDQLYESGVMGVNDLKSKSKVVVIKKWLTEPILVYNGYQVKNRFLPCTPRYKCYIF